MNKPVLFEDEIAEIIRSLKDGDTITLDDGTLLFKVYEYAVNDDGILSHVREFIPYFGNAQKKIYDMLEQGKKILVNGIPIQNI